MCYLMSTKGNENSRDSKESVTGNTLVPHDKLLNQT